MAVGTTLDSRPVVLIVDDEPLVRLVAREVLEDDGCVVIEAATAEEAVALLDSRADIAVLFSDVHMPGDVDGLALARMAPERWPRLRVAVTSGRARPDREELPPGTLFVPKPYRPDLLSVAVQTLLSGGSAS
jgi:CheY-like chemotaxis protein